MLGDTVRLPLVTSMNQGFLGIPVCLLSHRHMPDTHHSVAYFCDGQKPPCIVSSVGHNPNYGLLLCVWSQQLSNFI